jgi:hypothetical protein
MSATLSWILLGFGTLLLVFGWLWMVIVAFQRSAGWGLAVLLFPLAGLLFIFAAWEDGRRPFATQLVGLSFLGISLLTSSWPAFISSARGKIRALPAQIAPTPTAANSTAADRLSERLAALKMRERQLLVRKSKLDPHDTAAAHALAEEISRYNVDLKAAQEEQRSMDRSGSARGPK